MSQPAPPASAGSALKIVTQVFLLALSVALWANLFLNMKPVLQYVDMLKTDHARISGALKWAAAIEIVLSAFVFLWAGLRMQARHWHLAGAAQAFALINAFGIIALWGINTFVIAENQITMSVPVTPLVEAAALLLAHILTACMLAGVIRHRKLQAAAETLA